MKRLLLLGLLFVIPGCASAGLTPPAGTYDAAGTRMYQADHLIQDLRVLGQTARNLNAVKGKEHLTDLDTSYVRDFSLIAGAGLNAWGQGATTLAAARLALDAAPLPGMTPDLMQITRAAFDKAVLDHGARASTLYIIGDVYRILRSRLSVDAATNPKLSIVLTVVDSEVAAIPIS